MTDPSPGPAPAPAAPPPPRRRVRRRWRVLGGALLALLLLWLLRAPLLTAAGRWLSVEDPPARGDAIFVFGGEVDERPFAAAALWRAGWAPRVVVPQVEEGRAERLGLLPSLTEVTREVLRREGVPDSAVFVVGTPGGTTSTADDAAALREWLRTRPARRVIAVTSALHTRRARWHLRRALRETGTEVVMRGVPDARFGEGDWWKSEAGVVACTNEYFKWLHNLTHR